MKKISYLLSLTFMLLALSRIISSMAYSEEKAVSFPLSFSYTSTYWWRGVELDGKGVGVLWPGAGVVYGDFSFNAAVGISQDWISSEDSASKKAAKSLTELDLGAAYAINTSMLSVTLGVMYVGYPYFDAVNPDAVEASFIESSAVLTLKTLLSPYIAVYYDYFLHESDAETPVNEDYYVKFGAYHNLISTEDVFAFSLGVYIGYYNNAYFDMSGWSDAVATAGISKSYKNMSFTSGLNYGRTLGKDFKDYNGGIKNHFWATFGAGMTL